MADQQDNIQFEEILPFDAEGGDTGLSSRLKLKRNFDRIKSWMDSVSAVISSAVNTVTLKTSLTSNAPKVGHVETGSTFPAGTSLESVIRDILFKSRDASVSVSYSPSEPKVGQSVTLTANFDGGTGGLTAVSYQWYMDGEEIEGATGTTYTFTAEETQHSFYCVVTLSDDSTRTSNSVNIKGSVTLATLEVSVSATEAEVGSQVTVTAVITPGTKATAVNSIKFNDDYIENPSGLTFSKPMTVSEGENYCRVTVTMNDGTVLTDQVVYTGYYKWFAGKTDSRTIDGMTLESLTISGKYNGPTGAPYKFVVNNYRQIAFAVPQGSDITKLIDQASSIDVIDNDEYIQTGTLQRSISRKTYNVVLFCANAFSGEVDSTFNGYTKWSQ